MLLPSPTLLLSLGLSLTLSNLASAFCGTSEPSEAGLSVHRSFQALEAERAAQGLVFSPPQDERQIQVYVHVILESESDSGLEDEIEEQITVLNTLFAPVGFTFQLAGIETALFEGLGPVDPEGESNAQIKQLRQGGVRDLNLYIVHAIQDNVAGYATFPWDYTTSPQLDGVVMSRPYIPGGSQEGYNTGSITAHEVGHWLGLLHTFQDGCFGGDYVDDTPAEAEPAVGCPESRDSCLVLPGLDPIHNHMDYSNDACRTEFSPGQIQRMVAVSDELRPSQ
ncbi:hypothetical protein ASPCAL05678 [Aspergillus calidoustus]|uniref:Peptidase M43 pregnancy-associated plasma-A domain-containing protein n=1 Tax=Aspergillus calidoustus TaxID=454130 RepID=A0A0U5FYX4_ASPCI|nr:hypothetical protein ASPCAL05678 [Aspergillus calidoustus]